MKGPRCIFFSRQECHSELYQHTQHRLDGSVFKQRFGDLDETFSMRNVDAHETLRSWQEAANLVINSSDASHAFTTAPLSFAAERRALNGDFSALSARDVACGILYDTLDWLVQGRTPPGVTAALHVPLRQLVANREAEIVAAHQSASPRHSKV